MLANLFKRGITSFTMCNEEPMGFKEVDTLRVGLLGVSLISIIAISYPIGYFALYSMANYQELLPEILVDSPLIFEDIEIIRVLKIVSVFMFVLPQIISLILWLVMPSFIEYRYSLEALPPKYEYIDDLMKKIALKIGIRPPNMLYNRRNAATCFNMGKREGESTIVVSEWLLTSLDADELEAALTHEMAHTKNRDVTLMAYFAAVRWAILLSPGCISLGFLYFSFRFSSSPLAFLYLPGFWVLIAVFFLVYIFLAFGIQWFSRLRETAADARASLFVDKDVLKRTIYKVACARHARMFFVSSCLEISSPYAGGIFSTHPGLYKRYKNIDKKKYIIETGNPPSLKFCVSSAFSIFIFTLLVGYISTVLYVYTTSQLPQDIPFVFLGPALTAGLLLLYYEYLPWKYISAVILLISLIHFAVFFVFMLLSYFVWEYFLLPVTEILPPESMAIVDASTRYGGDLLDMVEALLKQRILFLVITFLITGFLRYVKKYIKSVH